jgi:nitroreductase
MEFTTLIQSRRSIRSYKSTPIPADIVDKLGVALQSAPSGNNKQPFEFIFVGDAELRGKIATEACHQDHIGQAPLIMVACCEKGQSFNVAIAVDHMILAAANEGIGSCWVGWMEPDIIKQILGIPDEIEVPIMVPLGYANEEPPAKERKPIEELIKFDRY